MRAVKGVAAVSTLTDRLWERFGRLTIDQIPTDVLAVAHQCILDWFGCALAGSREPLSQILREELAGDGVCSLIGTDRRTDPARAALINGAAGHALDFDDSSAVMLGHPSAPVLPAVLAAAERDARSGADALTAYIVGVEVQSRIGMAIGDEHYAKGWHTTSTVGVLGSAAAVGWLLGLDEEAYGAAMGIAASSSSGLKANFGTMTKPLHAGQAAERGLLAARLASGGFTAGRDAVDGSQGLAQAAGSGWLDLDRIEEWGDRWATTQALFKYHAACHCTHAGLEATRSLLTNGVDAGEIERITLIVNPSILDMCGIPEPVTGLEAKFSLRGTQALLVAGADTTAAATFDDGPINRPDVQAILRKVVIETDDTLGDLATRVEVLTPGGVHRAAGDVSRPAYDIGAQGELLRTKFNALAVPVLGETAATALAERLSDLIAVAEVGDLLALSR
ncbi:MAG: MmgE/PrpD family protein [Acidimicrobiaceae bacterium]|nr:MmgE/PrpD family protein [Acidimicrobiaceae bacterium]MYF43843.1 MmgE/PrpD family protein [Acidimicrobiaceae bacterium]